MDFENRPNMPLLGEQFLRGVENPVLGREVLQAHAGHSLNQTLV